jgi:hypothetical protein
MVDVLDSYPGQDIRYHDQDFRNLPRSRQPTAEVPRRIGHGRFRILSNPFIEHPIIWCHIGSINTLSLNTPQRKKQWNRL